ncbi:MAG: hypothetical protein ACYTHM_11210 [Planctomycetota bacterium]
MVEKAESLALKMRMEAGEDGEALSMEIREQGGVAFSGSELREARSMVEAFEGEVRESRLSGPRSLQQIVVAAIVLLFIASSPIILFYVFLMTQEGFWKFTDRVF